MSVLAKKFRAEKCAGQFPGRVRPNRTGAQNQHIHVIMLNALVRGVNVMTQAGPNPWDFVGRYGRTYTASANQDATIRLASDYGPADDCRIVRIIDRIVGMSA